MYLIPDTQHNRRWAKALTKAKPETYGHLEELPTFTPMYCHGLDGPIVQEMFAEFIVSNRNRAQMLQALQCALLCLAQCAEFTSSTTLYGFVHRRGTDQSKAVQRYKKGGFSNRQLVTVLDKLSDYVRYEKGFKGKDFPSGLASIWFVKPEFYEWLAQHRDSLHIVSFTEQVEVVLLNNDDEGEKRKDYDDDEQTNSMRQRIISGNKVRKQGAWSYAPLDRDLPEDGGLRRGKRKKAYRQFVLDDKRRLIAPESLECRRVFKGDFKSGGRFYCGAQSLSKAERATIQIDGEPTIELDLKSLHARLLYNLEGQEAPEDCYEDVTPELRARNKMINMYLINNKDRGTAKRAFMADYGGTGDEADDAFNQYIDQHPKIAHHFFTSSWKGLQFIDSQIVDAVLMAATEKGVPVLPVHDSFIAKTKDAEWLRGAIVESYKELTGFEPVVDW